MKFNQIYLQKFVSYLDEGGEWNKDVVIHVKSCQYHGLLALPKRADKDGANSA